MRYELAIFDMDGTILDTLEDLYNSMNTALRQFSMPERTIDEIRDFVGNGLKKLAERSVPAGTDEETIAQVMAAFSDDYEIHCADQTRPYEGIPKLLSVLREKGFKTAVVSNKPDFAVQALSRQYFDGLLDLSVGEKPDIRKKPSPDTVNAVLEYLQTDREHAVYIGDSEVDLETARNAHVACLSVGWGFREEQILRQHGATKILHSADELLEELLR